MDRKKFTIHPFTYIALITLLFQSAVIASPSSPKTTVILPSEQISLEYPSPVRLEQILADTVANSKNASLSGYPIANQLFNIDKYPSARALKNEVIVDLNNLAIQKPHLIHSINLIKEQLKRWDVGHREFLSLDYDLVRIDSSLNPVLVGNFELLIPKRDHTFTVEGVVFRPSQIDIHSPNVLSHYLSSLSLPSSAHKSYVWLIYPDGQIKRSGYAIWNDEKASLAPGTVVFVGFNYDSNDTLQLEEKIATLISMRKSL